jgi:hypothetical protein
VHSIVINSLAIKGFHVLTSVNDGFGGFACGLLENIRDEYPKSSIITHGMSETQPSSSQVRSE